MKKSVLIVFLMAIFVSCKSSSNLVAESVTEAKKESAQSHPIQLGAERMDQYLSQLQGKRVALVVNQTSVIGKTHLVDTLLQLGVDIKKVFAPEHGFRGNHSAGAIIKDGKDLKTSLDVVSLYGKNKKPSAEMLADVDVVLFDIQDVGVRFYTYISTMHYVMEACAELGKNVVVLDRPNPNGYYIDGPILEPEYKSFIGMHAIPIVHGLTVGELAQMINGEKWLKNEVICDLTVVSCLNYTHDSLYQLPVRPSPNLPNMNSVYLYPYLGLFEGTNVSIGRGTDFPFQVIGRPGSVGAFSFTPRSIPGVSDNPKYLGKECVGETIPDFLSDDILSQNTLNLTWLILMYENNRAEDGEYFKDFFYKLAGNKELRIKIESGMSDADIRKTWQHGLDKYKVKRKKYLLYP
jgi:uncharacterized protein YbbC (DUF1343 family)|tara:strand:+ start:5360 stop:6577 length:1218 start_codon:yes stop_codon:yes gene_type:complete